MLVQFPSSRFYVARVASIQPTARNGWMMPDGAPGKAALVVYKVEKMVKIYVDGILVPYCLSGIGAKYRDGDPHCQFLCCNKLGSVCADICLMSRCCDESML